VSKKALRNREKERIRKGKTAKRGREKGRKEDNPPREEETQRNLLEGPLGPLSNTYELTWDLSGTKKL